MNARISLTLALRYLGFGSGRSVSNARKSLYGALFGIGISLVPLVAVLVVSDGMVEGISARLIELSSSHIRVSAFEDDTDLFTDAEKAGDLARRIVAGDVTGKIVAAEPERQGLALAVGKTGRSGATVRAVNPSFFAPGSGPSSLMTVTEGSLALDAADSALVGKKLASDIGLHVGDTFRLLTMRVNPDGSTVPRFSSFKVAGIVSSGYQEIDAIWVFIRLERGFSALSGSSSATFINVRTANAYAPGLDAVRFSIQRSLPDGFSVYTWKDLNRAQFQSFNTTRTLLLFIMLLIVFIASVNVSSALVMLVMERRQEIAIMKSTGSSSDTITLSFILAGFMTGLGGLIIGLPVGVLCAIHINGLFSLIENVMNGGVRMLQIIAGTPQKSGILPSVHLLDPAYYLEHIPVHLDFGELFLIAAGTLVLSLLVSLVPALRAGREKPVDAIRKL
jgi:lipoprotein-releasing system permease protein